MKELILLKCGELALKGLNRHTFEDALVKNCRRRIESLGAFEFYKAQSAIYIEPRGTDIDLDEAVERLTRVFGVAALTRSAVVEKNFDAIRAQAPSYLAGALETANTFKVEAKRSDKSFPMKSPELCTELGAVLLEAFPHLTVDVHQPDVTVYVEIRERGAYLHTDQIRGAGGLPVGPLCQPAVYERARAGKGAHALQKDGGVVWARAPVRRAVHRNAACYPRPLPGGCVHDYYAPLHDENCGAPCA